MPINRGIMWEQNERERECVQESGEKESCNGSSLAAIAAAASAAVKSWELREWSDPPPPYML
jgi:hypothetical protein